MEDPEQREHALSRMGELVFKPTSESGGRGVFIGESTPEGALEGLADLIRAQPQKWIAQELVRLSTVPTVTPDGTLSSRHVDLRPFAVFGEDITIIPGGLTRVALNEGQMIVNSSRGGGSKDTWVLGDEDTGAAEDTARLARAPRLRAPSFGGWTDQQQQQQQEPA
jgi:uncharacterized circularly permuted ATP-grasp superfamily protein